MTAAVPGEVEQVWVVLSHRGWGDDTAIQGVYRTAAAASDALKADKWMRVPYSAGTYGRGEREQSGPDDDQHFDEYATIARHDVTRVSFPPAHGSKWDRRADLIAVWGGRLIGLALVVGLWGVMFGWSRIFLGVIIALTFWQLTRKSPPPPKG